MERLFDFKNTIDDSPKTVARHFMKKYRPALLAKKKHRMTAVKLTDYQMANIGDQIIKQARAKGSKRIRNNRLVATLKPEFLYPSYREGLAEIIG